jgi:hypothetical protein
MQGRWLWHVQDPRKGASHQCRSVVQHSSRRMNPTNECSLSPADEGHPQFAIESSVGGIRHFKRPAVNEGMPKPKKGR